MISIEDCIALCGLTPMEVAAIAEHEHVPEVAAATLGQYLLNQQHGTDKISQMIKDDIRVALRAGNTAHAAHLLGALQHLLTLYGREDIAGDGSNHASPKAARSGGFVMRKGS